MTTLCRRAFLAVAMISLIVCAAEASEEPRGLLLRKGLVTWQMNARDARRLIEEDIHPKTLVLLKNQKQEGFGCERENSPGVTRCTWACCVDLGEEGFVHFATLWFINELFYAYDVTFDTPRFAPLYSALEGRFGAPSQETQDSRLSPMLALGQVSNYVVNTKRWDIGNTLLLLADRGGQGKPLAGHMYVKYLPLARETPSTKEDNAAPVKLPF